MNYAAFQKSAKRSVAYVTDEQDLDFQALAQQSLQNERVKKAFVFYALTDTELFRQFCCQAKERAQVRQMFTDLYYALNGKLPESVTSLAKLLRRKFFHQSDVALLLNGSVPSASAYEYMKHLQSLVREHDWKGRLQTREQAEYNQSLYSQVSLDNLFRSIAK